MGIFDPTPGARWARVLDKLAERRAAAAVFDAIDPSQIEQIGERMELMQRRMAAEMAIIEELRWLHDLGVLEIVAEVLPTLAERDATCIENERMREALEKIAHGNPTVDCPEADAQLSAAIARTALKGASHE